MARKLDQDQSRRQLVEETTPRVSVRFDNPGGPPHHEIAEAAYHRWRRQGGDAQSNWLEAERELIAARAAACRAGQGGMSPAAGGRQRTIE